MEPARGPRHRRSRRSNAPPSYTPNVEFSCEDAVRTRLPFLAKVIQAVIDAGATTVNIPDTVGYTIPFEYFNIITLPEGQRAKYREGRHLRPLPQRPGPVGGQLAGRRAGRRRAGGVHHQRHRRAGRQLLAGRGRHDAAHPPATSCRSRPMSTPSRSTPPAGCCRPSPASWCSRTRRSSAPTPLPTRRASTSTAC